MTTLKEYREATGLSLAEISRKANVDQSTVKKAETGQPVRRIKVIAILTAISKELGTQISLNQVDDLILLD